MSEEKQTDTLTATQSELSLEDLGNRVAARCKELNAARERTLAGALTTCDLCLQQGRDLLEAKARCKHGSWLVWLKTYFDRDERTAQRYMAAYLKYDTVSYLDRESDVKQMFLIAELSPQPEAAREAEKVALPPIIQRLNWLCEWITKEREDIPTWEPERRQELKDRLRPVVELYGTL